MPLLKIFAGKSMRKLGYNRPGESISVFTVPYLVLEDGPTVHALKAEALQIIYGHVFHIVHHELPMRTYLHA